MSDKNIDFDPVLNWINVPDPSNPPEGARPISADDLLRYERALLDAALVANNLSGRLADEISLVGSPGREAIIGMTKPILDQVTQDITEANKRIEEAEATLGPLPADLAEVQRDAIEAVRAANAAAAAAVEANNRSMTRLANGNFEDGLKYWRTGNSPELVEDSHSGTQAVLLESGDRIMPESALPVIPGQIWELQLHYKSIRQATADGTLHVNFSAPGMEDTGPYLLTKQLGYTNGQWATSGPIRLTVPEGTDQLSFRAVVPWETDANFTVDDFVLRDVTDVVRLEEAATAAKAQADKAVKAAEDVAARVDVVDKELAKAKTDITAAVSKAEEDLSGLNTALRKFTEDEIALGVGTAKTYADGKVSVLSNAVHERMDGLSKEILPALDEKLATVREELDASAEDLTALAGRIGTAEQNLNVLKTTDLANLSETLATTGDRLREAEVEVAKKLDASTGVTGNIIHRDVYSLYGAFASSADSLVIRTGIPITSSTMARIKIEGAELSRGATSLDITFYAYNLGGGTIHSPTATSDGDRRVRVRLAVDPQGYVVIILDPLVAETWAYPRFSVTEYQQGYSNGGTTEQFWAHNFTSDLSAYTKVVEPKLRDLSVAVQQITTLTDTTLPELQEDLTTATDRIEKTEEAIWTTLPESLEDASKAASKALLLAPVSTAAPTTADGTVGGVARPVGTIWTRINASGAQIGSWRWTGSAWAVLTLDPTVIPNLSASQITSGVINTARLNTGEIAAQVATVIKLNASAITAGEIDVARLNAVDVAAKVATVIKLSADAITSGTIATGRLDAEGIAAATGAFMKLDAKAITSGTIDTTRLNATSVAAAVAKVIELNADRITAGTINAARLNVTDLAARIATVIELNADRITAGSIKSAQIDTTGLAASLATIIKLDAGAITSGTIDAGRLNVQDLSAKIATVITLNASRITAGTIATARLDTVDIAAKTANIQTVRTDNLRAGTAVMDEGVAKKLFADLMVANRVTARQMTITPGNLWDDPKFEDPLGYSPWAQVAGGLEKNVIANQNGQYFSGHSFAVIPGDEYWYSVTKKTLLGTGDGLTRNYVNWYDAEGVRISYSYSTLTEGVSEYSFTAPVGAVLMVPGFFTEGSTTSTERVRLTDYTIRRKADGNLIVDGAITAKKLKVTDEMITDMLATNRALVEDELVVKGKLIANNATLINTAMKTLTVTEKASFVAAYAEQFVANQALIGQLFAGGIEVSTGMTPEVLTTVKETADGALARAEAILLKGDNLVVNGSAELASANGWPSNVSVDLEQTPSGQPGAFRVGPGYRSIIASEKISVDPSKRYRLSMLIKSPLNALNYTLLNQYDVDGQTIGHQHTNRLSGSEAKLTAPMKAGDRTVKVNSTAGFAAQTNTANAYLAAWPYRTAKGPTYQIADGYTRNMVLVRGNYVVVDATTLTLPAPWPGPDMPIGADLALTIAGGSYLYPTSRRSVTTNWELYSGTTIPGVGNGIYGSQSPNQLRPGCAFVSVGGLLNHTPNTANSTEYTWFTGVVFSDDTDARAAEDAAKTATESIGSSVSLPANQFTSGALKAGTVIDTNTGTTKVSITPNGIHLYKGGTAMVGLDAKTGDAFFRGVVEIIGSGSSIPPTALSGALTESQVTGLSAIKADAANAIGKITPILDTNGNVIETKVAGLSTIKSNATAGAAAKTKVDAVTDSSGNILEAKVAGLSTIKSNASTALNKVNPIVDSSGNVLASKLAGTVAEARIPVLSQGKVSGLPTVATNASNALSGANTANALLNKWKDPRDTTRIDGGNIYTGTIDADQIKAGAIKADKLDADAINGKTIDGVTITGGVVRSTPVYVRTGVYRWTQLDQYGLGVMEGNPNDPRSADFTFLAEPATSETYASVLRVGSLQPGDGDTINVNAMTLLNGPTTVDNISNSNGTWSLDSTGRADFARIFSDSLYSPADLAVRGSISAYYHGGDAYFRLYNSGSLPRIGTSGIVGRASSWAANMVVDDGGFLYQRTSVRASKLDIQPLEIEDSILDIPVRTWIDKGEKERHDDYMASIALGPMKVGDDGRLYDAEGHEVDPSPVPQRVVGMVAEEVEDAGQNIFNTYDQDGNLTGLMYERLGVALIPVVRRLRDRVDGLEQRLAAVESRA